MDDELIICDECNLSIHLPKVSNGQRAICPRCGYYLLKIHTNAYEKILAFACSAFILLLLSLFFDFVSLHYQGQTHNLTLLAIGTTLFEQDYWFIAVIFLTTVIILPVVIIGGLLYLILFIHAQRYPYLGNTVAKIVISLLPWSMAEIFLIGVLVSLIKISTMANVSVGLSFYAYVLFSISFIAAIQYIDKQQLFKNLHTLNAIHNSENAKKNNEENHNTVAHLTASQATLSIQKTWALLITSFFLYFPANMLPIMTTKSLGKEELNTILGGVIVLWQSGSYPIAIVIFVASIVVPIVKFIVLAWLNYSVQQQSAQFQLQRTQLYRITEFIGRWSMIDVFAVAILASLIQLGSTMTIYPGKAVIAFCGVVILTMFAANTFDARLIWEQKKYEC